MRLLLLLLTALLSGACAAAQGGAPDAGSGAFDGGSSDAGSPTEPTCRRPPTPGAAFAIDPAGHSEIGVRAAFDGTIWLVYSRAGDDGSPDFDVALTRLECDGTTALAPRTLSHAPNSNDVDPTVAVGSDRVLVAWSGDDGSQQPNLSLRYTELSPDGTPLVGETALATTSEGKPASANVWQPSLAPLSGGRFLVAGARGIVDQPGGFRAFTQELGADGQPSGDTVDVPADADPTSSMDNPVVVLDPAGARLVAWSREHGGDPPAMEQSLVQADGTFGATVSPAPSRQGAYPSAAFAPWAPHALLAFQSTLDASASVIVKDAFSGADGPKLELTTPSAGSFGPVVALSAGGGAVAWFAENAAGGRAIFAEAFTDGGRAFGPGTQTNVSGSAKVGPEAPAIVHVGGDLWFLAWSQGTSPDFSLEGRFVELK